MRAVKFDSSQRVAEQSRGARVSFRPGGRRQVNDPFAQTGESDEAPGIIQVGDHRGDAGLSQFFGLLRLRMRP
jgi:hypothetical protein